MPKLTMDVWPKENREVTPERWQQFLLRAYQVSNDLAGEFPELTVSVPIVTLVPRSRGFQAQGGDREQGHSTQTTFDAAAEDMCRVQRNLDEDRVNHDTVREQAGEDA